MIIFQDTMLSPYYMVYDEKMFKIFENKTRVKKDFLDHKKQGLSIPAHGMEQYASFVGYYTSLDAALDKMTRLLLEKGKKKEVVNLRTYIGLYKNLRKDLSSKFAGL